MITQKILKKLNSYKELSLIKKSNLFDEEYYLNKYSDVKKSGVDPLKHFYYDGYKEGRNPNKYFNTNKYMERYDIFNQNPLVHYINLRKSNPDVKVEYAEKTTVNDLIYNFFNESRPLKVRRIEKSDKRRLNIIYNGFDRGCFFGGKATALILATIYCEKYGYNLRIISQDPEANIFYEFLDLFNLSFNQKVEFFSIDSKMYIEVGNNDDFLCTMWSNADAVLNTPEITGKIFYIMQEVETFFYDHGDYSLRSYNTLSDNRIIPIVNSKLLYDFLSDNGYDNVKNNGIYFEPAFSKELLKPSSKSFSSKKKYSLLFYARPSHQRNVFYFGLEVINRALLQGIINPNEWKIYLIGDSKIPDFEFDVPIETKKLGVMSWGEYCKFLSNIDLCYGMIYTPHPSYPPLDAVSCGAVSLTNRYLNKQNLDFYSKNIVMADLNFDSMLEGLKTAIKLAKNGNLRRNNYEKHTNTYNTWEDAINDTLEFMHDKVEK